MRIADCNWADIEAYLARDDRCVLPFGSTVQHAQLSLCVDAILAERVAVEAAEPLGVPVYPAMPFGLAPYFAAFPGSVSLRVETLLAVARDLIASVAQAGFRRILIVNGHAGTIAPAEAAARAIRHRHGVIIPALHLWREAGKLHAELGGAPERFGHGGDPVASVTLHLRPDLCRPEQARMREPTGPYLGTPPTGFGAIRSRGVEFAVPMWVEEVAPGGVAAPDPRGANAAHGAAITERLVAAGAAICAMLRDHAP